MPATVPKPLIEGVRRFNRFYTKRIGVLEEGMVHTAFSLQEARVLYELGQADGLGAGEIAARLSLDAGYLSRLVAKLESQGLLTRQQGQKDRRRSHVALTAQGRKAFRKLDEGSRNDIHAQRWFDRAPVVRDAVAALRRLRARRRHSGVPRRPDCSIARDSGPPPPSRRGPMLR